MEPKKYCFITYPLYLTVQDFNSPITRTSGDLERLQIRYVLCDSEDAAKKAQLNYKNELRKTIIGRVTTTTSTHRISEYALIEIRGIVKKDIQEKIKRKLRIQIKLQKKQWFQKFNKEFADAYFGKPISKDKK